MKLEEYTIERWHDIFIKKALEIDSQKVVLLGGTAQQPPQKEGYKNLLAVDTSGNIIWIAELPRVCWSSYDTIEFSNNELIALAGSEVCKIDLQTGKIIDQKFNPWT